MKSLRYLNKYFFKYKWRLLLGILFIIATNIFNIYKSEFTGDSIDALTSWNPDKQNGNFILEAAKVGAIYIGLALAAGIFLFFTRQMIIIVSRFIEFDLKNEIFQQYQRLDYSFFKRNSTGDLMNRIS